MFKDEILENARRHKIYFAIKNNPGLHIRELQKLVDIPFSSLQYHLNYMTRRNVIVEEEGKHFTRYYSTPLSPEDKKILIILRHKRMRDIVMLILYNQKIKYQTLTETFKMPTSTLSLYVKRLLENNIMERTKIGYESIFTIKNENQIAKILIAYQASLSDTLVDKWAKTWLEGPFRNDNAKKEML
jgi:predicted transcriptional regulator